MLSATQQSGFKRVIESGVFQCCVCGVDVHRDNMSVCPDCDDVICPSCIDENCSCFPQWECNRCGGDLIDCMCI